MEDNIKEKLKELTKQNKEMRICYKSNLELCKFQEKQINKLATCLEEIYSYCKSCENYIDAKKIRNYIDEVTKQ